MIAKTMDIIEYDRDAEASSGMNYRDIYVNIDASSVEEMNSIADFFNKIGKF